MKHIKTITALLCCAALLLAAFAPVGLAAGSRYLVTAPKAELLSSPNEAADPVGEIYAGAYVYASEESGEFVRVTVASAGISGWVHTRYLRFADGEQGNPAKIKRIYIKTLPAKRTYTEDEEPFDGAGLSVWAAFLDGSADRELTGWTLYCPPFDTPGEKTVTVTYRAAPGTAFFSDAFTVTVKRVPLSALTLVKAPDKTDYIERLPLSLAGLVLRASYSDGRADRVFTADEILADPDFTVTGCHGETEGAPLGVGDHTVYVSYKYEEIRCGFTVSVSERTLTALEITKRPDSLTVYSKTEIPALSGMELTAFYDNGETELLTPEDCDVFCDPARFVLGGGNYITLSYGGKSVTLELTYAQEVPVGIRIVTPEILAFTLGEPIDLSALKVELVYASGKREETTDYTLTPVDPERLGAQTLAVRCGAYSQVFTIYIQEFYRRGDVNGDGAVTAADARLILRAAVGLISISGRVFNAADVTRDGAIKAEDARLALRAAVGLEEIGGADSEKGEKT